MLPDPNWPKSANGDSTKEPTASLHPDRVARKATPPRTMDIEPVDRARWTELACGFADHNYRQCWDFGVHAASRGGAKSEHVALRQAGEVVAIADVRVRELPVLGGGLAFVIGGPLTRNHRRFDPARYMDAVAALRRHYVEERGCILRILAPVGPPEWNDALNAGLTTAGFESTNAARPHRTLLLPVGGDVAEIRMRFHKKWRRNLRDSEREHIEVRVGSDTEFLDRFAPLFKEFVVRKGFDAGAYDAEFFQRVQRELPEHERYVVLLAECEGQPGRPGEQHARRHVRRPALRDVARGAQTQGVLPAPVANDRGRTRTRLRRVTTRVASIPKATRTSTSSRPDFAGPT